MKIRERKTIQRKNLDTKFITVNIKKEIKSGANIKGEKEMLRSISRTASCIRNTNS